MNREADFTIERTIEGDMVQERCPGCGELLTCMPVRQLLAIQYLMAVTTSCPACHRVVQRERFDPSEQEPAQ